MTNREAINIITAKMDVHQAVFGHPVDEPLKTAYDLAISALEKQEQTEEAIPHRNYQYLSDYWCECGWHLGKYNDVKFCANCGRKINWEKRKHKLPEPYTEEEV